MSEAKPPHHDFHGAYASGAAPWDTGQVDVELRRVLDAGLLPGKTALEIGCGTGTNALELARRGYKVTAVDLVPQAIDAARAKAKDAGVKGIDFRVADILRDDLGGPYDVMFDRGVYHCVRSDDIAKFQQVLKGITRPGTMWLSLAGNAKEQNPPDQPGPPRVHEHEIRAELGGLFDIVDLREYRSMPPRNILFWSILMKRK